MLRFLRFAELYSKYLVSPKKQASPLRMVSSLRSSVPGPAVPGLRGGPAAAAPGAGGAAGLECSRLGPGEGELGACAGSSLTEEAGLKLVGWFIVLELFENADILH